jgi:hypothetical protein
MVRQVPNDTRQDTPLDLQCAWIVAYKIEDVAFTYFADSKYTVSSDNGEGNGMLERQRSRKVTARFRNAIRKARRHKTGASVSIPCRQCPDVLSGFCVTHTSNQPRSTNRHRFFQNFTLNSLDSTGWHQRAPRDFTEMCFRP